MAAASRLPSSFASLCRPHELNPPQIRSSLRSWRIAQPESNAQEPGTIIT
jgi:hypothetical protein